MSKPPELAFCSPKPDIRQRPLITPEQATDLMNIFKILANDTRLRLLMPWYGGVSCPSGILRRPFR